MDWKIKTLISGLVVLIFTIFIFIIKIQYDTISRLKEIESSVIESKDIGNGIIRAQSLYVTQSELERLLKEQGLSISDIKKDLKTFGAEVQGIHTMNIVTSGYSGNNLPTTDTTPNPNPISSDQPLTDPNGYFRNQQWFSLEEPFNNEKAENINIPFGRVGFSAWQKNPWSLEVLPRKYESTTVLGQDEEGRHYAYSKFQIEADGKKYIIPISNTRIVEEYPTANFSFNPKLHLGVDGGFIVNPPMHMELAPNVNLSFFSYGQTKVSPQWTFLTFGLGYATKAQSPILMFSPINYNVGKNLPLIDNLYIGPSISVDFSKNFGLYIGMKVSL